MTLLERFTENCCFIIQADDDEIEEVRRALAIAQAVEEMTVYVGDVKVQIMRRADELLEEGKR